MKKRRECPCSVSPKVERGVQSAYISSGWLVSHVGALRPFWNMGSGLMKFSFVFSFTEPKTVGHHLLQIIFVKKKKRKRHWGWSSDSQIRTNIGLKEQEATKPFCGILCTKVHCLPIYLKYFSFVQLLMLFLLFFNLLIRFDYVYLSKVTFWVKAWTVG